MPIHVARVPDAVAAALRWPVLDARHRVKAARLDGEYPAAPGRGFVPGRSRDAADVIAMIMDGRHQTSAPLVLRHFRTYANAAPLEAVYGRRTGHEYVLRAAEPGTEPLEAIARIIDGWRWGPMRRHMPLFGDIRLVSAARDDGVREPWFEFDAQSRETVYFDAPPDREAFARGIVPAWGKPGGLIRTSMVHTGHLMEIADALGELKHAPAWPRYDGRDVAAIPHDEHEKRRASKADASQGLGDDPWTTGTPSSRRRRSA